MGSRPMVADLLWQADLARHDPHKLAAAIVHIVESFAAERTVEARVR